MTKSNSATKRVSQKVSQKIEKRDKCVGCVLTGYEKIELKKLADLECRTTGNYILKMIKDRINI